MKCSRSRLSWLLFTLTGLIIWGCVSLVSFAKMHENGLDLLVGLNHGFLGAFGISCFFLCAFCLLVAGKLNIVRCCVALIVSLILTLTALYFAVMTKWARVYYIRTFSGRWEKLYYAYGLSIIQEHFKCVGFRNTTDYPGPGVEYIEPCMENILVGTSRSCRIFGNVTMGGITLMILGIAVLCSIITEQRRIALSPEHDRLISGQLL